MNLSGSRGIISLCCCIFTWFALQLLCACEEPLCVYTGDKAYKGT